MLVIQTGSQQANQDPTKLTNKDEFSSSFVQGATSN